MRNPQDAVSIILARTTVSSAFESCSLPDSVGRILAQAVQSDLDLPPFQKSAMDGYAVHSTDFSGPTARLRCLGESRAGGPFAGEIPPGHCVAIYTGAEVPGDCDAVIVVEKSRQDGGFVELEGPARGGQHICDRGEDLREGQEVLPAGTQLLSAMVSLLASVGCVPVPVMARPRVAILATGDELIDPAQCPAPGQIREGNTLHLAALARAAGAEVVRCGVVRDDTDGLERTFRGALEECDILITTGGVSMGKYDLVGEALEAIGVEQVFHKVSIKPGKPIWFGTAGEKLVFGLPGNPVSCWVGHEVFVRPAIAKMGGLPEAQWIAPLRRGRWVGTPTRTNDREQHFPSSRVQGEDGVDELAMVSWKSSADLMGLSRAQALVVVPPGEILNSGDSVLFRIID
jgi:molybdopterin molybdotransferase